MIVAITVSMLLFAGAAYLGIETGAWLGARAPNHTATTNPPQVAQVALITATAIIGAILTARGVVLPQVLITGFVCACLCAAWWSDVAFGVVPDVLVATPLAIVLALAIWQREWGLLEASAVAALPFGIVAYAAKGKGIGRADALVAALGGALLGLQLAIIGFALACFTLFGVNALRNRQGATVAATPYMAASIVICILVRVLRV